MLETTKQINIHIPVLVSELLSLFSNTNPPQKILDCTFGRGGHSLALLRKFPQAYITGLDCDEQAISYGLSLPEAKEGKIQLLKTNFHQIPDFVKKSQPYDLIVMDLGVSSPQLDQKERGFGFYQDGPLDMRMDRTQSFKADEVINTWNKEDLISLFQKYGEIKHPYKMVEGFLQQRKKKKFETTKDLANFIQKHWSRRGNKHPATLWFLALRIVVNQELEGLSSCLPDFWPLLKPQGYWAIISFHSLEDRIVKQAFRQFVKQGHGQLWNKKIIRPSREEQKQNSRSRSAKLRIFQKTL